MEVVKKTDELDSLRENVFLGEIPDLKGSEIIFKGRNNIIFFEDKVTLVNSRLVFQGDDSVMAFGKNRHLYYLSVEVYGGSCFAMGRNSYMNGCLHAIASERCNIVIGDDCLISFGIWMRTADPHLIYDVESSRRINYSKDILVGDHVWLGQSCFIHKGSFIGSGSIVGALSFVAGKTIASNTSWGGNPARLIKEGVSWDGRCVHAYAEKDSEAVSHCKPNAHLFAGKGSSSINELLNGLRFAQNARSRFSILRQQLYESDNLGRFSCNNPAV